MRATALSLLGGYGGADVTAAFRRALLDDEPLLRRTAVSEAPIADPAERVARLAPLLADPYRAVRLEAASALAGTPPALLKPYQQEALATALADYVKAMEYSLDFSYAGHNLGLVYEKQNDPVRAEESYRRAIAVDDLWPPPKANLALLLARQGKIDEAEKLLREVVSTSPDEAQIAYSLGLLLAETGKMDEAATFLARGAAGMPANARASYNAGLALSRAGRDADAERMLRRAVELDPSSYDFAFALADFLLRRGGSSRLAPSRTGWPPSTPRARRRGRSEELSTDPEVRRRTVHGRTGDVRRSRPVSSRPHARRTREARDLGKLRGLPSPDEG